LVTAALLSFAAVAVTSPGQLNRGSRVLLLMARVLTRLDEVYLFRIRRWRERSQPDGVRRRGVAARAGVVEYALVAIGLTAMTAAVTWPHARVFTSHVISHLDPPFSMWRLAWFSHAIAQGKPLLHANIFFPEQYTYLLSDATLLQGVAAAPAIWLGVALPAVYNALLLFGIVSSGVAMYWLARRFALRRSAAALASLIFALAPYRIDHLGHLELQWIAPAIVAFGCFSQLLYAPRWRWGVGLAVALWLQFLSSVYYAIFLLPLLAVLAIAAMPTMPHRRRTFRIGLVAAILCAALTLPIARLYVDQGARVGPRAMTDITMFSATPGSYLAAPAENLLYGWTADRYGAGEKRLFPGVLALVLAIVGLFSPRHRLKAAAILIVVVALDLSLGANGLVYPWMLEWTTILQGLRAPARFAVFVLAGVSLLAALGWERVVTSTTSRGIATPLVAAFAVAIVGVEYSSPQTQLSRFDMDPSVYRFLRSQPAGVVLELPVPLESGLGALDVDYMFWSTRHWHELLNGYSGYYPASYQRTLDRLSRLPDPDSLSLLRERSVRYVLVHITYLDEKRDKDLLTALAAEPGLRWVGSYHDWIGPTAVFEVVR
jgi:hypothetical protein